MYKITTFNFEKDNPLDKEASTGFCDKWKKIVTDKSGRKRTIWIKIGADDWAGYYDHQSLGEVLFYLLAKDLGLDGYVLKYYPCIVNMTDNMGKKISTIGCYSYAMNSEDEVVIPLDKLNMDKVIETHCEPKLEYKDLILSLSKKTEIEVVKVRAWLDVCILLDSIALNTDRRIANLAVIQNTKTKKYRLAPLFDSGQTFFFKDNMLNYTEWDDLAILNNEIYSKLLVLSSTRFHDSDLMYTCFYNTEMGKKKLKQLENKQPTNTIAAMEYFYKVLGDNSKDNEKINVYPPVTLKEVKFIKGLLRDRMETVIKHRMPGYVPSKINSYDYEVYGEYPKYFKR